jgi:hypothetical protein
MMQKHAIIDSDEFTSLAKAVRRAHRAGRISGKFAEIAGGLLSI